VFWSPRASSMISGSFCCLAIAAGLVLDVIRFCRKDCDTFRV
jgi:hypothetical protein